MGAEIAAETGGHGLWAGNASVCVVVGCTESSEAASSPLSDFLSEENTSPK